MARKSSLQPVHQNPTQHSRTTCGKRQNPCQPSSNSGSPVRGVVSCEPPTLPSEPVPLSSSITLSDPQIIEVRATGRLSLFLSLWRELTSNIEVLEAIQGYRIPFSSTPPACISLPEPTFSAAVVEACDKEILRLLSKGAIAIVTTSPDQFLSSFFLIEKSSGGMRFILNLKNLNSYLSPPHFQLEDWRIVIQLLSQDSWMATLDLEDAYLQIPITLRI